MTAKKTSMSLLMFFLDVCQPEATWWQAIGAILLVTAGGLGQLEAE